MPPTFSEVNALASFFRSLVKSCSRWMSFANVIRKISSSGMNIVEEALNGAGCGAHLVRHAAARIEKDADTHRDVAILGEVRNFLLDTVFKKCEIVGLKVRHELAVRIGDGRDNVHKPHVDPQSRRRLSSERQRGQHECSEEKCFLHDSFLLFRFRKV